MATDTRKSIVRLCRALSLIVTMSACLFGLGMNAASPASSSQPIIQENGFFELIFFSNGDGPCSPDSYLSRGDVITMLSDLYNVQEVDSKADGPIYISLTLIGKYQSERDECTLFGLILVEFDVGEAKIRNRGTTRNLRAVLHTEAYFNQFESEYFASILEDFVDENIRAIGLTYRVGQENE